jgi:acyl carrier protein
MSKKLYEIVAKIMKVSFSEINDNSGPETIPSWTSFNGYVLLHELVSHYNVQFTIDEAMDVEKISDIKRHLKNHGVNLDD